VPFAQVQVICGYDPSAWLQIKAIPVVPSAAISIANMFVAPLLVVAMNGEEVHSTKHTIASETLSNDSLIV